MAPRRYLDGVSGAGLTGSRAFSYRKAILIVVVYSMVFLTSRIPVVAVRGYLGVSQPAVWIGAMLRGDI